MRDDRTLSVFQAASTSSLWVRFLCFLIMLPVAIFLVPERGLVVVCIGSIVAMCLSGVDLRALWQRTKAFCVVSVVATLSLAMLFHRGNSMDRLSFGTVVSTRFILYILLGMSFSIVTRPFEMLCALSKSGLPHRYAIGSMVAFRMVPMVAQRMRDVFEAQRARGLHFRPSDGGLQGVATKILALLTPLLHAVLQSTLGFSETLATRGYHPERSITNPPTSLRVSDFCLLALSSLSLAFSLFI